MNRNHKVRNLTFGIAAGALVATAATGFTTLDVEAAPSAGASSVVSYTVTDSSTPVDGKAVATNNSTVAGANQAVAGIFAEIRANSVFSSGEEAVVTAEETEKTETDNGPLLAIAQVDNYANVRSDANADSSIVGFLHTNNVATIEDEVDGWYKISSGNVLGYVRSDFLAVDDKTLLDQAKTTTASVNTDTLYIRNDRSKDSEVLGMIAGGEELTVLDDSDDKWVKVETETGEGYVAAEYVTVEINYTYAETLAEMEERIAEEEEADRLAEEAVEKAEAKKKEREAEKKAIEAAKASAGQESNSEDNSSSNDEAEEAPQQEYAETYDNGNGANIANYAQQFVGNPYVYGGSSLTNGTDCSGFVMSVYGAFGVSLPHSSYSLRSVGTGVSTSDMRAGDIVCYSGHVGIYVGNGVIVHASSPSTGIKYSNANYKTILAVRRIF